MKIILLSDLPEEGVSHDPQLKKKVILRDGELPHLKNFAQLRMAQWQVAHTHAHPDEYEIFLVEAGEGTVVLNSGEHQISAGTCVIFEPSEIHGITNTGSEELVLTYFGLKQ